MSGLFSSSSSTNQTSAAPWSKAQPYLEQGFKAGGDLMTQAMARPQAYAGPRVAGFSQPSQQGLNATVATASQPNTLMNNSLGAVNNITGSMGISQPMINATQGAHDVATGQVGANAIGSNLSDVASGNFQIDPWTQQAVQSATDLATNKMKASLGASGRFGANNNTINKMSSAAVNASAPIMAQAAQQQRQNQMQAAGMMSGEQLANIGNMVNSGQNLASMFGEGQTRALQAGGLTPSLNEARYGDANALMRAGSAYDTQNQAGLDALQSQFAENRDIPWQRFQTFGNTISGVASPYGTQTQTQPANSPIMNALGGAMGGAGLGLGLPGMVGGGLMGLFS